MRKAWIYTCIDAPEDTHGALKQQYEQLSAYGRQIQAEETGYSSDIGGNTDMGRPGLACFWKEAGDRGIEVLLILDSSRISREREVFKEFVKRAWVRGIEVVSVLEGRISREKEFLYAEKVRDIDQIIAKSFGLEELLAQGSHQKEGAES